METLPLIKCSHPIVDWDWIHNVSSWNFDSRELCESLRGLWRYCLQHLYFSISWQIINVNVGGVHSFCNIFLYYLIRSYFLCGIYENFRKWSWYCSACEGWWQEGHLFWLEKFFFPAGNLWWTNFLANNFLLYEGLFMTLGGLFHSTRILFKHEKKLFFFRICCYSKSIINLMVNISFVNINCYYYGWKV